MEQLESGQQENEMLGERAEQMERNAIVVHPERIKDVADKMESLSNILMGKDQAID